MKKLVLTIALGLVVSATSFAQTQVKKFTSIKDGFVNTKLPNGIAQLNDYKVSITDSQLEKIKNTEHFKISSENQDIELYLQKRIMNASILAMSRCKNMDSYSAIGNGRIYVNDENILVVALPYQAQNGYGNMIMDTAILYFDTTTGKLIR